MAKKPNIQDCDRRARQSARLGRLLRLLILLSGRGRWNIESLADELECSTRTVYRLLDALTACGVPWYLDRKLETYKIRDGFKIGRLSDRPTKSNADSEKIVAAADDLVRDGKKLKESLDAFLKSVESLRNTILD
jgi:predicted DNA-binding transcriptional regulator YafY